jgi:ketosteroid isomerase-like protein
MAAVRGQRSFDPMTGTTPTSASAETIGRAFAYAIARRDFGELRDLLHPDVELRALTPGRTWKPAGHDAAVDVLRTWFGDCLIDQVERVDATAVGDRSHVAYRFSGQRPDGPFVIEQQAYFTDRDGRIDSIRILCSGFRTPR